MRESDSGPKNGAFGGYSEGRPFGLYTGVVSPLRCCNVYVARLLRVFSSWRYQMTAPLDPTSGKASHMSTQCAQPDCWQQLRSQVVGCHPLVERCHINVLCDHPLGQHDRAGIISSSLVCVNTPVPPFAQPNVEHPVVLLAVCIRGPCGLTLVSEVSSVVHATVATIPHVLVLLNGHDLPTWASYSMDSTKTVSVTLPEQPHREQCWISKNESSCLVMIEPNADVIVPMSSWRVSAPEVQSTWSLEWGDHILEIGRAHV